MNVAKSHSQRNCGTPMFMQAFLINTDANMFMMKMSIWYDIKHRPPNL